MVTIANKAVFIFGPELFETEYEDWIPRPALEIVGKIELLSFRALYLLTIGRHCKVLELFLLRRQSLTTYLRWLKYQLNLLKLYNLAQGMGILHGTSKVHLPCRVPITCALS